MPLRRYHTPSFVRQTSSASIFPPLVSTITGLTPCGVPIPGPLVETGALVARVWAVADWVGDAFGEGTSDGDAEGEGETSDDGDGVAEDGATGSTAAGTSVAAEAFCD